MTIIMHAGPHEAGPVIVAVCALLLWGAWSFFSHQSNRK